jgi:hypothetical protein
MYETLIERYPELFPQRGDEVPFNDWGFELPDSDFPLMEAMCRALYSNVYNAKRNFEYSEKFKDQHPERFEKDRETLENAVRDLPVFAQIKTKFGQLRVYADNTNEYSDGVINMTEYVYDILKQKSSQ